MGRRQLLIACFLVATCLPPAAPFAAKKGLKKKGGSTASKKRAAAGSGGFGGGGGFGGAGVGGKAAAKVTLPASVDAQLVSALKARAADLTQQKSPQAWLETGALLVKAKEFGEAERVFRMGAHTFPKHEMLSAAALTMGGDSMAYLRSAAKKVCLSNTLDPLSSDSFVSFEAPFDQLQTEDQADRAVDWAGAGGELSRRGVVHQSKGPILDPEDCAWVIREVEAHCAEAGWSTARHVQAPTTDIPVSQVPSIRAWFDDMLHGVLFPMLAARYPYAIGSADELRVMDAFVVRYDAREQASLPTHQDENTFSFTIALNDRSEYEGGGTGFAQLRPVGSDALTPFTQHVLNADAGGIVTFPGKLRHGGNVVTSGRRYIIPLFIYSDRNRSGNKPGYLLDSLGMELPAEAADSVSRYAAKVGANG